MCPGCLGLFSEPSVRSDFTSWQSSSRHPYSREKLRCDRVSSLACMYDWYPDSGWDPSRRTFTHTARCFLMVGAMSVSGD